MRIKTHQNASPAGARGGAKRKVHDDVTGPATSPLGDHADHGFALVQTRVSERAKLAIKARRKPGQSEAQWTRDVIYEALGLTRPEGE